MLLLLIGLFVGTLGTLIGAGGGFILIPILLALYPEASHERITSMSMLAVALNASSGSVAYFLKKKTHIKAALLFTICSLPGAVLGVYFEQFVSRGLFEQIFGFVLIAYAAFLLLKKMPNTENSNLHHKSPLHVRKYGIGGVISFFVAFVASFLGIGGGIIHVPLLIHVVGFPVHLATGTSHLILAVTGWTASFEHISRGDISLFEPEVIYLGVGVVIGAQIGAALSKYVPGRSILKILAVALLLVGIRLLMRPF